MAQQSRPDFALEESIIDASILEASTPSLCLGIDEAGRGPWAGPVTAGAAWINPQCLDDLPAGIDDSKRLSLKRRGELWCDLQILAKNSTCLRLATASVSVEVIDRDGILSATFQAMENAVLSLKLSDTAGLHLLVDGNLAPPFPRLKALYPIEITPIIKGDSQSLSIAIAAIAAKQTRDALMIGLDAQYPQYDWKNNKGYGTATHALALKRYGVTTHHRQSFKPVAQAAQDKFHTR